MVIIESIILGLIICLPLIWVAKVKTDLNISNHNLDYWRQLAINERAKNDKV